MSAQRFEQKGYVARDDVLAQIGQARAERSGTTFSPPGFGVPATSRQPRASQLKWTG